MAKLGPKTAKEVAALLDSMPMPTEHDINLAKIAATQCSTPQEFADFMGCDIIVFKQWCRTNKKFYNAYNMWREFATDRVEQALAKRAIGFTKKTYKEVLTKQGEVVTLTNETYYPPDPTAAQFWLKNRNKEEWKDTAQIDVNVQADIRAWLVNAMSDSGGDASEVINLPASDVREVSQPVTVGTITYERPDNLEPLLEAIKEVEAEVNDSERTSETAINSESDLDEEPDSEATTENKPQDNLAELYNRWKI